jgi:hypothetical protein
LVSEDPNVFGLEIEDAGRDVSRVQHLWRILPLVEAVERGDEALPLTVVDRAVNEVLAVVLGDREVFE